MKINYISDLHTDFWLDPSTQIEGRKIEKFVEMILPPEEDMGEILILAGDNTHYEKQFEVLILELKKYWKHIIVTWGNHDLYLVSKGVSSKYKNSFERIERQKEICLENGVHFLDGEIVTIDGIRFGGTGNWYLLNQKEKELWFKVMNDSRLIADSKSYQRGMYSYGREIFYFDTNKLGKQEFKKLQRISEKGVDVFITHIGMNEPTVEDGMPIEYTIPPHKENNIFYYTQDLDLLVESGAKVHIHGHTHQKLKYQVEGVEVLCNPLGYPSENSYNIIDYFEMGFDNETS